MAPSLCSNLYESQSESDNKAVTPRGKAVTPRGSDVFVDVVIDLQSGRKDIECIKWTSTEARGVWVQGFGERSPKYLRQLFEIGDVLMAINDVDVQGLRLDAIRFELVEAAKPPNQTLMLRFASSSKAEAQADSKTLKLLVDLETGRQDISKIEWGCPGQGRGGLIVMGLKEDAPQCLKQRIHKGDHLVSINDVDVLELRRDAVLFELKAATDQLHKQLVLRFTSSLNSDAQADSKTFKVLIDLERGLEDISKIQWGCAKAAGKFRSGMVVKRLKDTAPKYLHHIQTGDYLVAINGFDVRPLRWDGIEVEFRNVIDSNKTMELLFCS